MVRDVILILEDEEFSRRRLTEIFQDKYKIQAVQNEREGVEILRTQAASIAAVLVNIMIPARDGFSVMSRLSQKKLMHRIPFIMLTNEMTAELEKKGYEYGVISYLRKPFHPETAKLLVNNAVEVFQYKAQLELMLKTQTEKLQQQNTLLRAMAEKQKRANEVLITSMSNIVEFRNLESPQHIKRVRELTTCLGTSIMKLYPEYRLTAEKLETMAWASALHDIGKIVIPDSIILKAGKLTEDEYEVIKSHTTKGAEIIKKVIRLENKEFCDYAYDIARHHHEKYDGNGYPDGLKGEAISIAAQIVSLVDKYDALTSKRIYKAAYTTDKAYQMIATGQDGVFNPKLLKAFAEVKDEFVNIVNTLRDN